ncbi:MAG: hypothetical protein HYY03_05835, partial [Chloroflexi bacterium]|nr:hypothetical protein [Chloroflexota bacterium]
MARLLPLLLLAVALGFAVLADGPRAWGSGAGDDASPLQLPAEGGDVLVFLREPPALAATPLDRSALRAQVSQAQERVLGGLAPADFQVRYRYQALPALAGTVSAQGLKRLAADPDVAAVWPDLRGQGALGQSVPLINANAVQSMGYSGAGSVVAVIDSGIDTDHPDLAGDLIHEECFMAGAGLSSRCPNGTTRQSGPGAAEDDHGHGT